MTEKKIKVGNTYIQGVALKLGEKNLVVLSGSKGYVMCGYLDMQVAESFKDAAVRITKVATIEDALEARAVQVSEQARRLGIQEGDVIRDILEIIA